MEDGNRNSEEDLRRWQELRSAIINGSYTINPATEQNTGTITDYIPYHTDSQPTPDMDIPSGTSISEGQGLMDYIERNNNVRNYNPLDTSHIDTMIKDMFKITEVKDMDEEEIRTELRYLEDDFDATYNKLVGLEQKKRELLKALKKARISKKDTIIAETKEKLKL